ncbi:hypothetical protein DSM112329_02678 [Paraconexibacter sp. AEG42_29]|uniref:DUF4188 domain-containing protein n=1 Tax=Paraconexibacter sp. AEG42_29 TaxID=2997339 RepID=A0AAU7AW04_9ACTN
MATFEGRYRAQIDEDYVVFIIGFRPNKLWQARRWVPVGLAMPPMVRELRAQAPAAGMLAVSYGIMYGSLTLVQHWRSFEHLTAYAQDAEQRHLPAWRRYNQAWRGNNAVGVFHETYRVRAGEYEAIYVDMPRVGLAAAGDHLAVGSSTTAAERMATG